MARHTNAAASLPPVPSAALLAAKLNQPLAIIRGLTELLLSSDPAARDDADLHTILSEIDRAAQLVQQILLHETVRQIGETLTEHEAPASAEG